MVLVFKTTVNNPGEARRVKPHLDKVLLPARWNFDLTDCDRILRVEGAPHASTAVISTLRQLGFDCAELD